MPQMAPLNWLSLYFMWIMVFWIFIILNYFLFNYQPKFKMPMKIEKSLNWKW